MYSEIWPLRICFRTTFSITKNETSSKTRIYAGPFTAQIKYPRDWQLTGVDTAGTGGRTGQSFPLHILNDKILLFSEVIVMVGADTWCVWVSSVSIQFAKRLFSTSLTKILLVLGQNFIEAQTLSKRYFALTGNAGLKKHWVVHVGLGEIENRWRQETNQTTIKSFQIRPDITYA